LTGNRLTFSQPTTEELAEELANLEIDNSQQELAIPADMNHPHSVPPASAATQSRYVPTAATRKPWGARKKIQMIATITLNVSLLSVEGRKMESICASFFGREVL